MPTYRLISLDDTVVFPHMHGDAARGRRRRVPRLPGPAPRHRLRPRRRGRRGGRAAPASRRRPRRGLARPAPRRRRRRPRRPRGPAARRGRGASRRRSRRRPHGRRSSASTAPSSTRSSSCAATTAASRAFVRSITEPGALADTAGYSPDLTFAQKVELLETLDVVERLHAGAAAPARAAGRAAGAQAHPRRRRVRRAEAAARLLPAPPDGLDPQGARRGRGVGRRRVPQEDRRRPGCPTPCASRPSASSAGSSAWATRTPSRR